MTKEDLKGKNKTMVKWEKNVHKFELKIDYFL